MWASCGRQIPLEVIALVDYKYSEGGGDMLLRMCQTLLSTMLVVAPQFALAGGFSGGGGNVIAVTPVKSPASPLLVRNIVKQARIALASYLIQKQQQLNNGTLAQAEANAFLPIFSFKNSIVRAIRRVDVYVVTDRPCYDRMHRSFDGSTTSERLNSICVSALNLSRKVELKQMEAESLALLLHEYTEVIGRSDEEAIRVQMAALADLHSSQPSVTNADELLRYRSMGVSDDNN